ncbi:MAG: T9SS type A sorting domain-containing protein [Ignavibacteriae bacterium]|nr:T9SS type A sorting domain-containing protein [Ignavibacteriota bacterium]
MAVSVSAQTYIKGESQFPVLQDTATSALLNINNVSMWVNDNGLLEKNSVRQSAGVTFPRGTSTLVYDGGLLWGGIVRDGITPEIRVGGQARVAGTIPGRITSSHLPENRFANAVRVFRIRPDWKTGDLRQDAAETFGISIYDVTENELQELRRRYAVDWYSWPWQKGAPYYERNGMPGYQPDTGSFADSTDDEPGLLNADQVIWLVCNDLNQTTTRNLAGSSPIGIEHQITCWAYKAEGELGNVIFQQHKIIYKGMPTTPPSSRIDSMYIAKWADTDVGEVKDDYSGCLINNNLGFTYNSSELDYEYNKYGLKPPVIGYDLLQGPRVPKPGGSAHWNFSIIPGYENLSMTSFAALVDSVHRDQPSQNNYNGTLQWWNLMRGFQSRLANPPECFRDPFTNRCTTYPYSGDPRTFQGWVDGRTNPPGDRRILLSSGPFQMELGDTQSVVVALIAAQGDDRVEALNNLESTDNTVQDLFNRDFIFEQSVPIPTLRIVELNNKFILDWESDTTQMGKIERYNSYGYQFEGYKIYQFKSPTLDSDYKLFPAFDPSSPRYLHLTNDIIRNKPLVNGQKYYYAVTAVMLNPNPLAGSPRIESPIKILTAVPHSPNPGVVYPYDIGDTVTSVVNKKGYNDAPVTVTYFDPSKAKGDSLKILFHYPDFYFLPTWDLVNMRTGDMLVQQKGINNSPYRVISEGLAIQVRMPLFGVKGVYQTFSNGISTNDFVFNQPNPQGNYMVVAGGASQLDSINGGTASDRDIEFRFLGDSSWALLRRASAGVSRWVRVPYTVWQMERDPANPIGRQVYSVITQQGNDSMWRATTLLDRMYNGKPLQTFYPITVIVDSLQTGFPPKYYGGTYIDDLSHPTIPIVQAYLWVNSYTKQKPTGLYRLYFADVDEDGIAVPANTVIRFKRYKDIFDGDEKLVLPSGIQYDDNAALQNEISKINVFPNPYYAVNRAETGKYERFVTFNHLPYHATIRLFNLGGVLVRTITKNDETQFFTWDLNNENSLPVASGLYVAHLELKDRNMIDLGTKTLKLMIVQEQRFKQGR